MNSRIRFPALAVIASLACVGPAAAARSGDTPAAADARGWEQMMSRSAVLGMQLGIQRAFDDGQVAEGMRDCVNRIDPTALVPLLHAAMVRVLTVDEIDVTERFWRSDAGAHLVELVMAQQYERTGIVSPNTIAPLGADEQVQIAQFNSNPVRQKLSAATEFRDPDGGPEISARLQALLRECRVKSP